MQDNTLVTIRTRLILTLLLVGIPCTLASVAIVHQSMGRAARLRTEGLLAEKVASVQIHIAESQHSMKVAAELLAAEADVVAKLRVPHHPSLDAWAGLRAARGLSTADALVLLDPRGGTVLCEGPPPLCDVLANDDTTQQTLIRGTGAWWTVTDRTAVAVTMRPVTHEDRRVGLVVAAHVLDSLLPLEAAVGADLGLTFDGEVLAHTFDPEFGSAAEAVLLLPPQPEARRVAVDDQRYLMQQLPLAERLDLGVLVPLEPAGSYELFRALALLGVFAMLLAAVMLGFSSRAIGRPLERLVTFARNAADGDLRPVERHAAIPEIAVLEDALNDWLRLQLRRGELDDDDSREGRDREIDRWIQRSMLPSMPAMAGYDLSLGSWRAADAGGDCCEAILCENGVLWIAIGEAATRSLRAGMLATLLHGCLEAAVRTAPAAPPSHILAALDHVLTGYLQRAGWNDTFVALRLLRLGPDGGLAYAGAHEEMLLLRAESESCEQLDWRGAWLGLGMTGKHDDPDGKLHLGVGDTLLLYTDGVLAAQDGAARLFGTKRIAQTLTEARGQPARVVSERLMDRWERWARRHQDDATLLVIRRRHGTSEPSLTL